MNNTSEQLNNYLAIQKYTYQAKTCEILRHYVWASIMWRRAGRINEADKCERIVQAMAENNNIKLLIEKPIIVG